MEPSGQLLPRTDFAEEIDALHRDPRWWDHGYCARPLPREKELRRVLFALRSGFRIRTDCEPGSMAIHVLAGHLELHIGDSWDMLSYVVRHTEGACSFFALFDHTIDLPRGSLIDLDPRASHDLEAIDDSAFVLDVHPNRPPLDHAGIVVAH
jgi:hypothetical protein